MPPLICRHLRRGTPSNPPSRASDQPPLDAEHIEELVPEGLFLGSLAPCAGPIVRELNGAVADFVPGKRHGRVLPAQGAPVSRDLHGFAGRFQTLGRAPAETKQRWLCRGTAASAARCSPAKLPLRSPRCPPHESGSPSPSEPHWRAASHIPVFALQVLGVGNELPIFV